MAFVSYYNYRCYHKTLSNATPSDVLQGRREEFLRRRKEVQAQTTKGGGASTGPSESSVLTLDNDNSLGSRSVPLLLIDNSDSYPPILRVGQSVEPTILACYSLWFYQLTVIRSQWHFHAAEETFQGQPPRSHVGTYNRVLQVDPYPIGFHYRTQAASNGGIVHPSLV